MAFKLPTESLEACLVDCNSNWHIVKVASRALVSLGHSPPFPKSQLEKDTSFLQILREKPSRLHTSHKDTR